MAQSNEGQMDPSSINHQMNNNWSSSNTDSSTSPTADDFYTNQQEGVPHSLGLFHVIYFHRMIHKIHL